MSRRFHGTPVVPGIGYATTVWLHQPEPPAAGTRIDEGDVEAHVDRFHEAAQTVSARLAERSAMAEGDPADILIMSSALAVDKGLDKKVCTLIRDKHLPAERAVFEASNEFVEQIKKAGGLLAERCTDIVDMRNRVIAEVRGEPEPGIPTLEEPSVLCADDLAPADTAGLDPTFIRAIATVGGGPTSHTSIIARQLGIPCVVGVRSLREVPADAMVLVDGRTGKVELEPDEQEAKRELEIDERLREKARAWKAPGHTADDVHVALMANVQDHNTARKAAEAGAEGVGLLRTELAFLSSQEEPSEEAQAKIYGGVFDAFDGSKVVVRTLDAGSDKPIAWLNHDHEENPALGVRGLRTNSVDEGVLTHQLDAIAAAAKGHEEDVWVMAPMVSTVSEARWFASQVRDRGLQAGIMVEVPAVAVLAPAFMREVDFVSIGTNDLTQYVMAADRTNAELAQLTDSWQPALLALIAATAKAGKEVGKPVGVCGEAAADPLLALVLTGMGVSYLSMAAPAISTVGVALESVTLAQCEEAAQRILDEAADAEQARSIAQEVLG